jgi:hypothetical protein
LFFNMMYPDVPPSVPYLLNKVRQGQRNLINLMVVKPRGEAATAGNRAVGSQGWVIRLTYVNHYSVVSGNRLKVLKSLDQNGAWTGTEAVAYSVADIVPPAYRWNLSHP